MTRPLPWDKIKTPTSDYNVRLISGGGGIPTYWGRDAEGHCLFLISLEGDHSKAFSDQRTSAHGIDVDLQKDTTSSRQNLVLTLERQVDADLFSSLCESLFESLRRVDRPEIALNVALTHIKRWKTFLAGRNSRLLSGEEIRGLFAELTFLTSISDRLLSKSEAVSAWTGADGVHQDFVFADRAVEVKSLSGTDRSTVRISSEDQLESVQGRLFLVTYRLRDVLDADHGQSLNELVSTITTSLTDAAAVEEFERRLAAYGFLPLPEYDKPRLEVLGAQAYRVKEGFPRIVRSVLPPGISNVKYQIEIERIAPFGCPMDEVLERN